MATEQQQLQQLREEIDAIDQQIQALISRRAACAQQVAEVKQAHQQLGNEPVFYRPEREAQVLRKVMERNGGPLDNEEMARLFREIMSACLALERPLRIAFLGPQGTFTQQAALKHFGHSAVCLPMHSVNDVFREVEAKAANYGVVPIENSTEGVVHHTLDNFRDSPLKISGEVELRIHQHLLGVDGCDPNHIRRIYSHQQSLAQCRQWLDARYPKVERIAVSSNAEAARLVAAEGAGVAAIAGDMAAQLYGLQRLFSNIEDRPDNSTRFLILGHQCVPACGKDKTSILVNARNQPGALYHILEPFHRAGISLTRIETRPANSGAWGYVFFIDFEGHQQNALIKSVLDEVASKVVELKVLGSYPQAVL